MRFGVCWQVTSTATVSLTWSSWRILPPVPRAHTFTCFWATGTEPSNLSEPYYRPPRCRAAFCNLVTSIATASSTSLSVQIARFASCWETAMEAFSQDTATPSDINSSLPTLLETSTPTDSPIWLCRSFRKLPITNSQYCQATEMALSRRDKLFPSQSSANLNLFLAISITMGCLTLC